ncbi:cysteine-rich receptor-like protein kinase 8, partial [Tanacetum coccineum]
HYRLGHLSSSNLKHVPCDLLSKLNANSEVCLSCPMAKFTKLSYSYSKSHATEPFNLVHIDIWGPYKVPTNGNFRYFLTIVDDFSRATWTYFLKKKSDSFKVLTTFCKFVQTQFDSKVKVIRSDNALEFLKGVFGCLAMASNPDRTADKFSPRGVPCLFLGYPQHQKGYKLCNILTKTKFVSRDVQFYEEIFPYSKPDMLKLLNPLPSPCSHPTHWYDDYVTTTAPNAETQAAPNVKHATESITSATSTPLVFVPTVVPTINAPIPLVNAPRRSARNTTPLVWLQDYVLPTVPRANQVSVTRV